MNKIPYTYTHDYAPKCTTKCPFGTGLMVGSIGCGHCCYFQGDNYTFEGDHYDISVNCSHK